MVYLDPSLLENDMIWFFYFDVGISQIFDELLLLGKIIFPTSEPKWFRRMGEPNGDFFMAI